MRIKLSNKMKNREIKFRVWHHSFSRFLTPDEWFLALDGKLLFSDFTTDEWWKVDSDYTIQQYTGLKDKNNKEIYEGDILVYSENDPTSTADRTLVRVEYKVSGFCYRDLATNKLDSIHAILGIVEVDDEAEIIGNIFENLDLLN